MRHFFLAIALLLPVVAARAQFVAVSASHLTDASGSTITGATIYFAPESAFRIGGNGQAVGRPVSAAVTAGAFSLQLADTTATQPQNVCYNVWVSSPSSGTLLGDPGGANRAYSCVQVSSTWCSAGVCNFDNYVPNLSNLALIQTGPPGPAPSGTGVVTATGGVASTLASGTSGYCLVSNGPGTLPTYQQCASGGGNGNVTTVNGASVPASTSAVKTNSSGQLVAATGTDLASLLGATFTTPAQAAAAAPVQSVAGRTGTITLAVADVSGAQPSASPNANNAGIGNCSSGQYETGNVAGTSPQCAQVQASQVSGLGSAATQNSLAFAPDLASAFYCDSYASLNACLDAAKLYVTTNESGAGKAAQIILSQGVKSLTAPYTLNSGMQIFGVMPRLEYIANSFPDSNMILNGGTVIDCGGTSNTCFTGSDLRGVSLERLGFQDFGTVLSVGGNNVEGIAFSTLRDIIGVGSSTVGASSTGLSLYNFAHVRIDNVKFYGVNTGYNLVMQSSVGDYGASLITDIYVDTYAKSVANGNSSTPALNIQMLNPSSGNAGSMNDLVIIRPHIISNGGDGTNTEVNVGGVSTANSIIGLTLQQADIEGFNEYGLAIENTSFSHFDLTTTADNTYDIQLQAGATGNTFTCSTNCKLAPFPSGSYIVNTWYGLYNTLPTNNGSPMNGVFATYQDSIVHVNGASLGDGFGDNGVTNANASTCDYLVTGFCISSTTNPKSAGVAATDSNGNVIAASAVMGSPGAYGNGGNVPTVTVDSFGRVTAVATAAVNALKLTPGSLPTCNSGAAGEFWYVQGNSTTKDTVQVCAHDATNTYAWRAIY